MSTSVNRARADHLGAAIRGTYETDPSSLTVLRARDIPIDWLIRNYDPLDFSRIDEHRVNGRYVLRGLIRHAPTGRPDLLTGARLAIMHSADASTIHGARASEDVINQVAEIYLGEDYEPIAYDPRPGSSSASLVSMALRSEPTSYKAGPSRIIPSLEARVHGLISGIHSKIEELF